MSKISRRKCIVCKKSTEKVNLIRIVYSQDEILIDLNMKLGGRGAYIHKTFECTSKLNPKIPFGKILKPKIKGLNLKQQIEDLKKLLFASTSILKS